MTDDIPAAVPSEIAAELDELRQHLAVRDATIARLQAQRDEAWAVVRVNAGELDRLRADVLTELDATMLGLARRIRIIVDPREAVR